jgi:RNA polymerase sigma factor (sigma-70 family)
MHHADLAPDTDDLSHQIEAVIATHSPRLRAAAHKYGVDAADVDLVLQETRLRIWKLAERGEAPADLRPGLIYRIATGAAIDLVRRRDARREVSDVAAAAVAARDGSALDRVALRAALRSCLAKLAQSRRAVVAMHLRGSPREEIAALLRWSDAKTRNLLYRGLDDLRLCLRRAGFEGGT